MRIVGVDPGSVVTGFGIIDYDGRNMLRIESGVIEMRSDQAMPERLRTVFNGLRRILEKYPLDAYCLETAFYSKNVQSTMKLGQVRGVALLVAAQCGVPITEYSPREVKRAVTGNGGAAKQQVEYMVKTLLRLQTDFRKTDEADGLAIAICHALHVQSRSGKNQGWDAFMKAHPERIRS